MDGNGETKITTKRAKKLAQKRIRAALRKRGINSDRWL
jgi:hypothetical protein